MGTENGCLPTSWCNLFVRWEMEHFCTHSPLYFHINQFLNLSSQAVVSSSMAAFSTTQDSTAVGQRAARTSRVSAVAPALIKSRPKHFLTPRVWHYWLPLSLRSALPLGIALVLPFLSHSKPSHLLNITHLNLAYSSSIPTSMFSVATLISKGLATFFQFATSLVVFHFTVKKL